MRIFKKNVWGGITAVLAFILCIALIMAAWAFQNEMQISNGLGVKHSEVYDAVHSKETYRYPSAYTDDGVPTDAGLEKLLIDEYAHCVKEIEEGAVLLKNDTGALPLKPDERNVTLFGHASVQPLYRARSGGAWTDGQENLLTYVDAMKGAGFNINGKLIDAYAASSSYRGGKGGGTGSPSTAFLLGEEPSSFYTADIKNSFSEYKDAAIVMLAREGGETRDLPVVDYEGISHLALHKDEKDLLALVKQYKDSGTFSKVILLLNTTNAIEIGWLNEYGIDSCMWIGGPGLRGFEGVANLLTGKANPSGRLIQTYAANSLSAPALVNFGDIEYTNYNELTYADQAQFEGKLVVYAEGIYQGYKYYETRYEDVVLNRHGANSKKGSSTEENWSYSKEITYPFGHGLSYTEFKQTLDGVQYDPAAKENTVTVTIKNIGDIAGKSIVELYSQTPYEAYEKENLVEKSAIQLAGFIKTGELAPLGQDGDSETVEIAVDEYLLASYDYVNIKGYYLSAGNYYFSVGDNAHDALNNVLAAKGVSGLTDFDGSATPGDSGKTYMWTMSHDADRFSVSDITGNKVTNLFDNVDINYWVDNAVTYLSRQDWDETYPMATTTVSATQEMLKELDGYTYKKPVDAKGVADFTLGKDSGIKFVDMYGVPYESGIWDKFVEQLTIDDMVSILDDSFNTRGVVSVAKPEQKNNDGPDGAQQSYIFGDKRGATCYPIQSILSSTWNIELAEKRGEFLGEDNLYTGATQMWSPAANLHRTPFSGRNYEYWSEDPVVGYNFLGIEVAAMQRKGINVALKHLVANDQETNRYGVCTFMTEQTLREGPLRGFESAFTIGGALGVMTTYNRLGCTYAGQSSALQIDLLEGEWGFKGIIISDAVTGKAYQHPVEMQAAGNDMYCINVGANFFAAPKIKKAILDNDDGYLLAKLIETNKQFYYAFANSNLVNGLTHDSYVLNVMPWWQSLIITVIVVLAVATLASLTMSILSFLREKREDNPEV